MIAGIRLKLCEGIEMEEVLTNVTSIFLKNLTHLIVCIIGMCHWQNTESAVIAADKTPLDLNIVLWQKSYN